MTRFVVTVTSTMLHERRSKVCSTSCALSLSGAVRYVTYVTHKWYVGSLESCVHKRRYGSVTFVRTTSNVFLLDNPWCLRQKLLLTKTGIPP